jgi:hypothetical protein
VLAKIKTKASLRTPTKIIFKISNTPKLAVVMGWKKNTILMIKEMIR